MTIARRNTLGRKRGRWTSEAEIKGAERKREEEIKRAGRNDSVMKSVSGHYFTHTDLIPRRVVAAARNYEQEEGWRKEWREEKPSGEEGSPERNPVVSAG